MKQKSWQLRDSKSLGLLLFLAGVLKEKQKMFKDSLINLSLLDSSKRYRKPINTPEYNCCHKLFELATEIRNTRRRISNVLHPSRAEISFKNKVNNSKVAKSVLKPF